LTFIRSWFKVMLIVASHSPPNKSQKPLEIEGCFQKTANKKRTVGIQLSRDR